MKNKNELNYKDLKLTCDQSLFNFEILLKLKT